MLSELFRNTYRFVLLVLLQGLVLDQVALGGVYDPYLYVLFILLLPFETPGWLILVLAFLAGFGVDLFAGTVGMHASASVTLGFVRPFVLRALEPREGYESGMKPSLRSMGFSWFFSYAGILILVHHIWLNYVEIFHFGEFFRTLWRAFVGSALTLAFVVIVQFLLFSPSRRL